MALQVEFGCSFFSHKGSWNEEKQVKYTLTNNVQLPRTKDLAQMTQFEQPLEIQSLVHFINKR